MGYATQTPLAASVQKVVTENYESTDLDITDFTFNPRSETIAFSLRLNRADGTREEKAYQIPRDEFNAMITANIEAFQKVRAACFNWLVSKNEIPAGTDNWPN